MTHPVLPRQPVAGPTFSLSRPRHSARAGQLPGRGTSSLDPARAFPELKSQDEITMETNIKELVDAALGGSALVVIFACALFAPLIF